LSVIVAASFDSAFACAETSVPEKYLAKCKDYDTKMI
jgi:hypothetical protein